MNHEEIEIRNPQFTENGMIDCEINHPECGWIPFTASQDDEEQYGKEIYARCLELDVAPYIKPPVSESEMRALRDAYLNEVDVIVTNPLRWADLTDEQKERLAEYRQLLLDVPQQEGFPEIIDWPIIPTFIL